MTIAQAFVTYATCWWLVLFMVLPFRVKAAETPGLGHVRGAPSNPMIRKKAIWATGLAILPTLVIYFFATVAKAEDAMYTTKSGCKPLQVHQPRADVNAQDGYSTHGKKVKPATIDQSTVMGDMEHVDIPLRIPAAGRLDQPTTNTPNPAGRNVDLSQSFVNVGGLDVNTKTGETLLNGQPVGGIKYYQKVARRRLNNMQMKFKALLVAGALFAIAGCTPADEQYCQSFGVAGTPEFGKCLDFYHREQAAFGADRAVCDGEADYTYPTTLYDYGHTERVIGGFVPTPYGGQYIGGQTIVVQPDYQHNAEVDRLRMRIIEPCMQARGWNSGATWQAGRRPVTVAKPKPKPSAPPRQLQPTGSMNLPWLQ